MGSQVGEDPTEMDAYATGRNTIRREHLSQIMQTFGFGAFDVAARSELSEWLAQVAASTDSGVALVEALLEEMRRRRIVVPALYAVEELAWEVRRKAREEVARKLTASLTTDQLTHLDDLLMTQAETTRSALVWLRQPPGEPAPKNFHKVVEKLRFVRSLGLSSDAARIVHHTRLSRLAAEGARMTPQNLFTLEEGRRRATLVAYLLERAASLTDEALEMHERMMNKAISDSRKARDETAREQGKKATETLGRYAGIGRALIIAREQGLDPYETLEDFMPWEAFVESVESAEEAASRSSGALDYLRYMEDQYARLRRYAPLLLESFNFEANPPEAPLLEAVEVLKEMNEKGKRKVPDGAPTGFVRPGWEPYVFKDDGNIDRHNYEMSLISGVKDGPMSGDVWVSGSNKYKDFEDYLLPRDTWEVMRASGDAPVAVELDLEKYLEERSARLHEELGKVSRLLGSGKLPGVRLENGELKISRLKKEEPEGMDAFRRKLYSFMPRVRLTDLLVEADSQTNFSRHFTHLRSGEPCRDKELIYGAILADGTNLGLTKMAEATEDPGTTYERLAWASDWHISEETYQKAIAKIVNAHYRMAFTSHWGEGKTSSSDGQVFFAGGPKDALSQPNARYGRDPSVIFYTHISDQYAPFYSRVINTTVRDATCAPIGSRCSGS